MPKVAKKKKLSTVKRVRQSKKRQLHNRAVISKVKTIAKRIADAVGEKDKKKIEQLLKEASKTIQSAVSKGVLHKNTAARKISRLSKLADTVLKAEAA